MDRQFREFKCEKSMTKQAKPGARPKLQISHSRSRRGKSPTAAADWSQGVLRQAGFEPGRWRGRTQSSSAKFLSTRSPAAWLFSGWNCVANRLSRQMLEQNGCG